MNEQIFKRLSCYLGSKCIAWCYVRKTFYSFCFKRAIVVNFGPWQKSVNRQTVLLEVLNTHQLKVHSDKLLEPQYRTTLVHFWNTTWNVMPHITLHKVPCREVIFAALNLVPGLLSHKGGRGNKCSNFSRNCGLSFEWGYSETWGRQIFLCSENRLVWFNVEVLKACQNEPFRKVN